MSQDDERELEKLNLSKKQVLDIIDSLVLDFSGNKKDNWEYIWEAKAVKALIKWRVPEEKFDEFWKKFIKRVDSVRYDNAREELPKQFKQVYEKRQYIDFSGMIK